MLLMEGLRFSENITRLRREKKITQEELALFIGVTKASVSKWETGATIPDIMILPQLAAFFDVSIDELLGYEPQLSREQIKYYYHKLAKDFAEKPFDEVMRESEELTRKYYSCYPFLQQMVILWINHGAMAPDEKQKEAIHEKITGLCERILENCKDMGVCNNTIALKCLVDLQSGHADKVIELLEEEKMNVNRIEDKGTLLTLAYMAAGEPDKAEKAAQIGMYRSLLDLIAFGENLITLKGDDLAYLKEIIGRLDAVIHTFVVTGLNPNTVAVYDYHVATLLCSKAKEWNPEMEQLVKEKLEQYVEAVRRLFADGLSLHGDEFFSTLDEWFADMDLGIEAVRSEKLVMESALEGLENPVFARINDQEFIQFCIKKLKKIHIMSR